MNRAYFDELYATHGDDPWGYHTRFYERRKRDVLLASLGCEHYGRVLECAAGNGVLAAALATRCDALLACDATPAAVAAARVTLASVAHAAVENRTLPDEFPSGRFDCVVVSEVGYYLTADELVRLSQLVVDALSPDGEVVLCHWRHPIAGCALTGDQVHAAFAAPSTWTRRVAHVEADFVLDVWSPHSESVAAREDLR